MTLAWSEHAMERGNFSFLLINFSVAPQQGGNELGCRNFRPLLSRAVLFKS